MKRPITPSPLMGDQTKPADLELEGIREALAASERERLNLQHQVAQKISMSSPGDERQRHKEREKITQYTKAVFSLSLSWPCRKQSTE